MQKNWKNSFFPILLPFIWFSSIFSNLIPFSNIFPMFVLFIFFLEYSDFKKCFFISCICLSYSIFVLNFDVNLFLFARNFLPFFNIAVLYFFLLKFRDEKLLYNSILISIFVIYLCIIFQILGYDKIFHYLIAEFRSFDLDNMRGMRILSPEPSRASINLFAISFSFYLISKNKLKYILYFNLLIEIFLIRSLTGLFLWAIFFAFYNPRVIFLLLIFFLLNLLFKIHPDTRILTLTNYLYDYEFIKFFKLLIFSSGSRFQNLYLSLVTFVNNPLGLGFIDLKQIVSNYYIQNYDLLTHVTEKVQEESFLEKRVKPPSIFLNILIQMGLIGIFICWFAIKEIFKYFKNLSKLEKSLILTVILASFSIIDYGVTELWFLVAIINNENIVYKNV